MYQLGFHVSDPVSFVNLKEFLSYWIPPRLLSRFNSVNENLVVVLSQLIYNVLNHSIGFVISWKES